MGKRRYLCIYLPAWAANLKQKICKDAPGKEPEAIFIFKALYGLALWAVRFSPLVGLDRELTGAFRARSLENCSALHYGIILDTTGTERLYGCEHNLISLIRAEFDKNLIGARFASAPTICAAWALSRYGRESVSVIDAGGLFSAVSVLPVESLRISSEHAMLLSEFGIRQIEQLLRFPPADLNIRFGPLVVQRIEEMLGHRQEIFSAVHPPEAFVSRRKFETPLLQHESVKKALLGAFDELLGRLRQSGKKAGSFRIFFNLYSEALGYFSCSRELSLHFAVQSFSGIAPAVDAAIESLSVSGALLSFEIKALNLERPAAQQTGIFLTQQGGPAEQDFSQLMNNLALGIGSSRIREVSFRNSHIPEKSFAYRPVDGGKPAAHPSAAVLDRPSLFFNLPQPLKALSLLPDHPPAHIQWKGEELRIVEAEGPEKICGEWWNHDDTSPGRQRYYYKLQDHTGRILWVFRDENMDWFVHGVYA